MKIKIRTTQIRILILTKVKDTIPLFFFSLLLKPAVEVKSCNDSSQKK
jgi:hypothetical protein